MLLLVSQCKIILFKIMSVFCKTDPSVYIQCTYLLYTLYKLSNVGDNNGVFG